jgi:hypothetical protein
MTLVATTHNDKSSLPIMVSGNSGLMYVNICSLSFFVGIRRVAVQFLMGK